ncbi:MAG: SPOR domain-containing protein [Bacteroidales bacterium]|jgi:hypothetical protein|nr:SPOR domain-containing protein [Bacteroidales bacterium]
MDFFRTIFCTLTLLTGSVLFAQHEEGKVNLIQSPVIDTLVQKHIYYNQLHPTIDGWRIQIFFDSGSNSKNLANKTRDKFLETFPDRGAYLSFNEPYYKVRVGDFKTRIAAEAFLQELNSIYSNAFIVPDQVYFERL